MYVQSDFNRDGEMLGHWLELPVLDKVSIETLTTTALKAVILEFSGPADA